MELEEKTESLPEEFTPRDDVTSKDLVIRTIIFYKGEKWQNDIIKEANNLVFEPMNAPRDRKDFRDFIKNIESYITASARVTLANVLSEQRRTERNLKPFPK
jgi:hypothetical protein